jgi:putative ABC transport system permease protein
VIRDVSKIRALVEAEVEAVDQVVDRARGWARVVSPETSIKVGLTGIDVSEETRLLDIIQPAPTREYLEAGDATVEGDPRALADNPRGAIVFAGQARRLGVRVGDPLTVIAETLQGQRNSEEVTVVAVARDIGFMSNFSMFLSKATLRRLYRLGEDVSGVVQIYLEDYERAPAVMRKLRARLEAEGFELMPHEPSPFFAKFGTVSGEGWTGQRLDTTVWRDEVSFLGWILTAVDTISFTLVATLLVIIAIGIMNSMWISVRERTNEIGTLRAMGMSRRQVLGMFLLEAVLLGGVATTTGAALGAGVALGLDAAEIRVPIAAVQAILMSDTLHMVVEPLELALAVAVFTVVAGLSALWPALRAARLQPVTAIHHVG